MFFRALSAHSLPDVQRGFDAHVKDPEAGRYQPVPSHILAQIEGRMADDGRPGPAEAWAKSVRAADEGATVVWTEEMAQAWGVAAPLMANGDDVGACMAFRESYSRMVDEARRARRVAVWSASLGFDADRRKEALSDARLPAPDLLALAAPVKTLDDLVERAPGWLKDRLAEQRAAAAQNRDPMAWATALRDRQRSGEQLTPGQLAALANANGPTGLQRGDAVSMHMTPIPHEHLPPAMRAEIPPPRVKKGLL